MKGMELIYIHRQITEFYDDVINEALVPFCFVVDG